MRTIKDSIDQIYSLKKQLRFFQILVVILIGVNIYSIIPEAIAAVNQTLTVSKILLLDKKGNVRYKLYVNDLSDSLIESVADSEGNTRYKLNVSKTGRVDLRIGSTFPNDHGGWNLWTEVDTLGQTKDVNVFQRSSSSERFIMSLTNSDQASFGVLSEDGRDVAGIKSSDDGTRISTVRDRKIRFSAELVKTGSGIALVDRYGQEQFMMGLRESDNKLFKTIANTPGEEIWNTISSVMTAKGVYELVK